MLSFVLELSKFPAEFSHSCEYSKTQFYGHRTIFAQINVAQRKVAFFSRIVEWNDVCTGPRSMMGQVTTMTG